MKNTILNTARKSFNNLGIKPVTARHICSELGISPGSFSYHFPDKSKIIETLYSDMLTEHHATILKSLIETPSIVQLHKTLKELFTIQYHYRFFFLHIFEITSQHPSIKELYIANLQKDKEFIHRTLEHFAQNEIIKKDISQEEIYELVETNQGLSNQWIANTMYMNFENNKSQ